MIQRLAVLGDSILRGVVLDEASGRYVHLKESCVAGAQQQLGLSIDNFSRFGMTSEKGLQVARQRLPEQGGYDACLICFGGNDVDHCWKQVAEDPQGENPPHVACGRYIENMGQMVELARQRKMEPILFTLPPIDSQRYFRFFSRGIKKWQNILQWLGSVDVIYEQHKMYSERLFALANQLRCRIIDIRNVFLGAGDYKEYLCSDGIHPNARGHALMQTALVSYVRSCQ